MKANTSKNKQVLIQKYENLEFMWAGIAFVTGFSISVMATLASISDTIPVSGYLLACVTGGYALTQNYTRLDAGKMAIKNTLLSHHELEYSSEVLKHEG